MSTCAAFGCTNRSSKKIPGITFHKFPKDEHQRAEWVKAVRRKNWMPSESSKLCSMHFTEDMMDRTSLCCVRLRENAIPSVFDAFHSYVKNKQKSCKASTWKATVHKAPTQKTTVHKASPVTQGNDFGPCATSDTVQQDLKLESTNLYCVTATCNVGMSDNLNTSFESDLESFSSSNENFALKSKIEELEMVLQAERKKVKTLQQKVRRYSKRVNNFKKLFRDLKQKQGLHKKCNCHYRKIVASSSFEVFANLENKVRPH